MIGISFTQTGMDEVVAHISRVEVFLRDPITECKAELTQWFRDVEARAFTSQGATTTRQWRELEPRYRQWKKRRFPGRTILERTGRLRASLQVQTSDSIVESTPRRLVLGTSVEYARFHQSPGQRPFIAITNRDAAAAAVIVRRKLAGALGQQVGVAA